MQIFMVLKMVLFVFEVSDPDIVSDRRHDGIRRFSSDMGKFHMDIPKSVWTRERVKFRAYR